MEGTDAISLVAEGDPIATVVVAEDPSPIATYARDELVHHVEAATGAALPTTTEADDPFPAGPTVYVGDTAASEETGLDPTAHPPETALVSSEREAIYLLGEEDPNADPLDISHPYSGTLFAVYELLKRELDVSWLWPGPLGTDLPDRSTLEVPVGLDLQIEPAFSWRRIRKGHLEGQVADPDPQLEYLGFTQSGVEEYTQAVRRFLRRHRLGNIDARPAVGHYFKNWWKELGDEHPEWFKENADGSRGPPPDASERERTHVPLCVSDSELHRYIVEEDWDGGDELRLGEVDVQEFCHCPDCTEWDEPVPENPPDFASELYDPLVSNRYARFWQRVAALATPENPDVQLTTYLYWNYLPAPTADIDVPENVYGGFVPWGQNEITYFPLEEPAYEWLREQWREWERTGITMGYRPNHYHGGYVLPYISTWQAGDFFQFGAEHGMVGFDFDKLVGHWATKGPMFYVQFRLFVDPGAEIADLRKEYFDAFGPAADAVEEYFDFWERHSESHTGKRDIVEACAHLSTETFAEAEAHLDAAEAEAADADSVFRERVAFLRDGLEHARLCWEFVTALEDGAVPPAGTPERERAEAALERLRAYRREHESPHIADFLYAAEYELKFTEVESLLPDLSTP